MGADLQPYKSGDDYLPRYTNLQDLLAYLITVAPYP